MTASSDVTRLLLAAHDGDEGALSELVPRLYGELRDLARACLQRERPGHTLQPTALVNEAWLKLVRQDSVGFRHRAEFFTAAATTMRRILVDHARGKKREKRGGDAERLPLDETILSLESHAGGDLVHLEDALQTLAAMDERKAKLVELRFFAGLEMRQTAEVLGLSLRQAEREWTTTRAWLRTRLDQGCA